MIKTILITNDPGIAIDAQEAGISRIMVDLETGPEKIQRQATRTTFISTHVPEDVAKMRKVVTKAELIVRVNPLHSDSEGEIDHAVGNGADLVMQPMITKLIQFEDFLTYLDGRAKPLPLIETSFSMAHISDIAFHPDVSEVYFGLNDLHLSLGLDFLFEPLALGIIDWMGSMVAASGKSFGFGGMAAIGGAGELPPEFILGEHARMGSSCVILSSRFAKDVGLFEPEGRSERLAKAMQAIQTKWDQLQKRSALQVQDDTRATFSKIRELSERIRRNGSL